jgi:YbbR domain-containing protein
MVLSVVIAAFLWGVAHGSASIELGFDIPVVLQGVPDDLVSTGLSSDEINIRVLGTRAALRNVEPQNLEYTIDVSGTKPGVAEFEVEVSRVELPRGARILSRSPAEIDATFERRGSKTVGVRAEISGEPAVGYVLASVGVQPQRVRITGARRTVQRVKEVATEPIDVTGLSEPEEREVKLSPDASHVWLEEDKTVKVQLQIEADPKLESESDEKNGNGSGESR